jgi:fumarate hydratase subunit alpha/L(+)-tartrate dehydratase alpha subunit
MSVVATDLRQAVEDAAAYLYVWALKDIPQDLRDALAAAKDRETSTPGKRVLETIVRNVEIADDRENLVCQDTGIAVYTCRVGEGFPLHPARIYEALKAGTERGSRSSTGSSSPTGTGSTSSACRRARARKT